MSRPATIVTYLEMFEPPEVEPIPPRADVRIERIHQPTVTQYRQLYNGVGKDYGWTDRNCLDAAALREIICDPAVEIYGLTVDQQTAGYAELDLRLSQEIQLAYFGLFPSFVGQGLGKYFLTWTLQQAWSRQPRRVWVHTCNFDHPAALPNYVRAGFQVYRRQVVGA